MAARPTATTSAPDNTSDPREVNVPASAPAPAALPDTGPSGQTGTSASDLALSVDGEDDDLDPLDFEEEERDEFSEEELGWAIGSELEFLEEGTEKNDDWDGPVGDGLDEEEGEGGMSVRPASSPPAPPPSQKT